MARYSPGLTNGFPDGCVLALPCLFSGETLVPFKTELYYSNFEFTTNYFNQDRSALTFQEVEDKIGVVNIANLNLQEMSFCLFIKPTSFTENQTLFFKANNSGGRNHSYQLGLFFANPGRLRVRLGTTAALTSCYADTALSVDTWYWIYMEFGSNQNRIYIDNVLDKTCTYTGPILYTDLNFAVGNLTGQGRPFTGSLSQFYAFDHKLSSYERAFMFSYYPLNRGSLGGSTFQKSGQSFAIRSRKKPITHRTIANSNSHTAFHNVQSNIQTLTPSEKAAFAASSPDFPKTNSLGQEYILKSGQLFNSQNVPLVNQGLPLNFTSAAPVVFPSPTISNAFFEPAPTDCEIITNPVLVPSNFIFEMWASAILESNPSNPGSITTYRMLSIDEGGTTNISFGAEWDLRFGNSDNADQKWCVFQLDIVSKLTGQKITAYRFPVQVGV